MRSPPATTPTPPPSPVIAAYMPSARVRSLPSGKVTAISDRPAGAASAAPTPCSTRAVISSAEFVAKPPSSEARVKNRMPALNIRRRPRISPARPPSISRPPNVTAYPVTTHSRPVPEKCSACWMCGRAVLTMSSSSTSISWAMEITTRASPRCRDLAGAAASSCTPVGLTSVILAVMGYSFLEKGVAG